MKRAYCLLAKLGDPVYAAAKLSVLGLGTKSAGPMDDPAIGFEATRL